MNMCLVKLLLVATLLGLANSQVAKEADNTKDVDQDVEVLPKDESSRDKRGFILTPLEAIPPAALAPLLPYLRAALPAPVLSKLAPVLAPAQLIAAQREAVVSQPELSTVLSATAPLIVNRAAAAASSPVVPAAAVAEVERIAVPVANGQVPSPVITANVPAVPTFPFGTVPFLSAPQTVASSPFVSLTRLTAAPASSVITTVPFATTQRLTSPILPVAPRTVASVPGVAVARLASAPVAVNPITPSLLAASRLTTPVVSAGSPVAVTNPQFVAQTSLPTGPSRLTAQVFSARPAISSSFVAAPVVQNTPALVPASFSPNPSIVSARVYAQSPVVSGIFQNSPAAYSGAVFASPLTSSPVTTVASSNVVFQPSQFAQIANAPSANSLVIPRSNVGVISPTYFGRNPAVVVTK